MERDVLSADEYERRVMASMFGTPASEVGVLIDHDRAFRQEIATLREALMVVRTDLHRAPPAIEPAIRILDAALGEKNDR